MNSTTQVIINLKPWAFVAIVAVSVICAIIRYRSLSSSSRHYSAVSHSNSSSTSSGRYFNYTAKGSSPESQRHYQFNICKTHEGYKAYIVQTPSYRNRETDGHSTHRLYDGRYYVCWDRPVNSYDDMITIAKHWSDCSQKYIEQGTRF